MTVQDCRKLTAMLAEMTAAQQALLLGLLCAAYQKAPAAEFWKVMQKFSEKRVQAHLIGGPG
jgi:hypothetical protein